MTQKITAQVSEIKPILASLNEEEPARIGD
jgi:hypothetical protein